METNQSAREQFLVQRNEMMKQARDKDEEQDAPNAFADFSSFGDDNNNNNNNNNNDNNNTKKGKLFDAPSDVTDATDMFFEAITSEPPPPSTTTTTTNSNNNNIVSNTRHAELLKQARQDQVAWVEKDVVSHSPPAPSFVKGVNAEISSIGDIDNSNQSQRKEKEGNQRKQNNNKNNNNNNRRNKNNTTIAKSNEEKTTGGKTSGFLNTTERLFGFLNRFDAGDDNNNNNSSKEQKKTQSSNETKKNNKQKQRNNKNNSFNYKYFKEKLKNPAAAEILKTMKSFVQNTMRGYRDTTKKRLSRQEYGTRIRDFLNQLARRMKVMDHWRNESEEEWENTIEGVEKFLMSKIYEAVFCPQEEDKEADVDMSKRIKSLSFVEFRHLDISGPEIQEEMAESWKLAMGELRKMDGYKAPRDKMVCLLNCCKVISQLLSDARTNADEKLPGADEFLPALIYVVLKANPSNLKSNLEYIDCFRNPDKMLSEPGYWYTNLYSAVTFIENVQHDSLTITEDEFESGMNAAKREMEVAKRKHSTSFDFAEMNNELLSSSSSDKDKKKGMDLNLLYAESRKNKSALMDEQNLMNNFMQQNEKIITNNKKLTDKLQPKLIAKGNKSKIDAKDIIEWKAKRFRFAHLNVNELKVVDVGELLEEYKNLVNTCRNLMEED